MREQSELEARVQEWLDEIKDVPPRDPRSSARGRARFLGQAVSASELRRHKGWNSIFRKERFAMNVILSLLVLAGLLFGGGATVNAAQDDLPNQPLYSIKTMSEDVSLQFQSEPEEKVGRLMELSQVRLQEMERLVEAGQPVPDQVRLRLEQHIRQALQVCAYMDESAVDPVLLQIRDRLRQQDRDMEQLQNHSTQAAQPSLLQTRTMLRQHLQLAEEGLLNHEMFRNTVRNGFRHGPQTATPAGRPTSTPRGTSTGPGPSNNEPGGPNAGPGGSNPDPGGPNVTTPAATQAGNGQGGSCSGCGETGGSGSGGSGSGGSGSGGTDTGGGGSGGTDTGGGGTGGSGTGGDGSGGGTGGSGSGGTGTGDGGSGGSGSGGGGSGGSGSGGTGTGGGSQP